MGIESLLEDVIKGGPGSGRSKIIGADPRDKYKDKESKEAKIKRRLQKEREAMRGNYMKFKGGFFIDIEKAFPYEMTDEVGQTGSGESIYGDFSNDKHESFSDDDHSDAAKEHMKIVSSHLANAVGDDADPKYSGMMRYHLKQARLHQGASENEKQKGNPGMKQKSLGRNFDDITKGDRTMFKTNMPDSLIKGGPGNRVLAISELDVGNFTDSPASIIDDQIQKGFAQDYDMQKGCAAKKSEEKDEEPVEGGEEPTVSDEEINKKSVSSALDDIIKGRGPDKQKRKDRGAGKFGGNNYKWEDLGDSVKYHREGFANPSILSKHPEGTDSLNMAHADDRNHLEAHARSMKKSFGSENLKNTHGENWHSDADKMVVDYLTSVDKVNPYDESHNQLQHIDPNRPQHVQDRSMLVITR